MPRILGLPNLPQHESEISDACFHFRIFCSGTGVIRALNFKIFLDHVCLDSVLVFTREIAALRRGGRVFSSRTDWTNSMDNFAHALLAR